MKYFNYDFTILENLVEALQTNQSATILNSIRLELNKFFKDSNCKQLLFTRNTDKLFFGICTMPALTENSDISKIILSDDKIRIDNYYIEIDSKLLDIGLNPRELVACLLHEVGHMVNDSQPIDEVRNAIAIYLNSIDTNIDIANYKQSISIIEFGVKDALRKSISLFSKIDEEIIADEFIVSCGYGPDLESAYKKIIKSVFNIDKDLNNRYILLNWAFNIYKDIKSHRVRALKTLNLADKMTGCALEKREIDNVTRNLSTAVYEAASLPLIEANIFSAIGKSFNNARKDMKHKGMRQLEDDLYEYSLRVKNVDEEDEALSILRAINTRLAIIDDYLTTEKDISDSNRKRWFELADKYSKLRNDLSIKTTYSEKYYGLFVKTPVIKSRYEV